MSLSLGIVIKPATAVFINQQHADKYRFVIKSVPLKELCCELLVQRRELYQ